MNILILSCGTRNKVIQYFKKALDHKGQIIAADCSKLAPALYDADKCFITKRIDEEGYLKDLFSICKGNNINAILSFVDPELSVLAKYKQKFLDIGAIPIISEYNTVEMCFDKYEMFKFLTNNGIKTIRSYTDKEEFYNDVDKGIITYPVFVKPVKGSASIDINKASSKAELEFLYSRSDNMMIQEFIDGIEYGADVYIDMISGETVSIFTKEKIKMRAGETDKSVSVKDKKLFELIIDFVKKAGLKGIIDIDIFKVDGEYYISEVNPRFGGGYPHAYECGVNIPQMIINNINGRANVKAIGDYEDGVFMMKYNEIKIVRKKDLITN